MPTHEENMQTVLDMRARVLDPDQADPSPDEIWAAIDALHATRGVGAAKKKEVKPVVDLASLFAPTTGGSDGTKT
jgi:hypothetical protein